MFVVVNKITTMSLKKTTYESIESVTDLNTGEITVIKSHTQSVLEKEPDYVKLYVADIMKLNNLPRNSGAVMNCLLRSMSYNNIIPAYAPIKRVICKELNIGMDSLNKAIDSLFKAGMLIRIERGVYMADPNLFGKGEWKNIKNLRLIIDYKEDGTKQISGGNATQLKLF
jgi:hypothetical protein